MSDNLNSNDDFIERIWSAIIERQRLLNRQLEETEGRIKAQNEKGSRLIQESEKKFFHKVDKKNLEMKELDEKIIKHLENNKVRTDGEPEEFKKEKRNAKRRGKIFNKFKLLKDNNDSRYNDYSKIHDAIADSDLDDEEKQTLMEIVSNVFEKFTRQP